MKEKQLDKLEWYAYYYQFDFESRQIQRFNIFEHRCFLEDTKKNARKNRHNPEAFLYQLKKDLIYYYWCKAEWELVVCIDDTGKIQLRPWTASDTGLFLDVSNDKSFNWNDFANYAIEKKSSKQCNEVKIDVYDQIMFNWKPFTQYMLSTLDIKEKTVKKHNPQIDEDYGCIVLCALRYGLGRRTYITGLIADYIKRNLDFIETKWLNLIVREIEQAKQDDMLGDECDKTAWLSLEETVKSYLKNKKI